MEYLVIGPSSMGIFGFIGSLKRNEHKLKNIKEISGSSAGALLATCLALEFSLDDVLDKFLKVDIEKLTKYKLRTFFRNYGLIDMELVRDELVVLFEGDPTFKDLKMKLHISAYNLNKGKTEYFSVDTDPDMRVIDAVCMSISVPLLACKGPYNGHLYLDGGTKEDVPLTPFFGKPYDKVLTFKLLVKEHYIDKIQTFNDFITTLLGRITSLRGEIDMNRLCKTISVSTGDFNIFNFNLSHDDKLRMFFLGYGK